MFKDKLRKQYAAIVAVVAILFSWLVFAFGAQAQTTEPETKLEIVPANPEAYQPVTLRVTSSGPSIVEPRVKMHSNRITVTVKPIVIPPPLLPSPPPLEVYLGQMLPGNYEVEVLVKYSDFSTVSRGVKPFVVAEASKEVYTGESLNAFSDLWWNPEESGWGMNVTVKNRVLFATWFVYDSAGRAAWLTIQGFNSTWPKDLKPRCYQGQVLRTSGPPLGGILGLNSKVDYDPAGSAKLCFSDDNQSVQFTYTVDGVSNQKTLYRQPF